MKGLAFIKGARRAWLVLMGMRARVCARHGRRRGGVQRRRLRRPAPDGWVVRNADTPPPAPDPDGYWIEILNPVVSSGFGS